MFEEYLTELWICPKCGETDKVRVEETTRKNYKRSSLDVFEYTVTMFSKFRVYCWKCGSECYLG